MQRYLLTAIIILILGGFAFKAWDTLTPSPNTASLEIIKSAVNSETFTITEPNNLAESMTKLGIPYTTQDRNGQEIVTELAGVITTMSKSWNLSINNITQNYTKLSEIVIKPNDQIRWHYQAITQ